ncbi:MAG TPA: DNA alkylation repair protein [Verrucomicrobiae bacterium]
MKTGYSPYLKMTATTILGELEKAGRESYKRTLMNNHGVKEPCFGVSIADLKKFQKLIKCDYKLALELYDSGNYDAMYLAGLIADVEKMSKRNLEHWVKRAYGGALPATTVASVAAGSNHGRELALKWIDSTKPNIASAGWATLSTIVSVAEDAELDIAVLKQLVHRVQKEIHRAPDIPRYHMNSFLIAVGSYVPALTKLALETAEKIGPVKADLGNNHCKIPFAPDYIRKVEARGSIGKKRKSARF